MLDSIDARREIRQLDDDLFECIRHAEILALAAPSPSFEGDWAEISSALRKVRRSVFDTSLRHSFALTEPSTSETED